VVGPAKQQMVDRAKEQERRVLARTATGGKVKQLIMVRDGLA
jgi:endonuclease YncB( thermonuclease family)